MVTTRHTSPFAYPDPAPAGSDPVWGEGHAENPHSLPGTGALRSVKDAAQALGLRPWLAALPLRERRLRARLLMCAPNGGLSVTLRGRDRSHCGILSMRGSDLELVRGRSDPKAGRLARHNVSWLTSNGGNISR